MEDLQLDGEGSPISIKKVMRNITINKDVTVLVDNSHQGYELDDESYMYITIKQREEATEYYIDNKFNEKQISEWMYRYIYYMLYGEVKYNTKEDLVAEFNSGKLTLQSEEFQKISKFIKYSKTNLSSKHIVGLILNLAGILSMCKKKGVPPRVFIELPETGLHPQMQAKLMSLINIIRKDYE